MCVLSFLFFFPFFFPPSSFSIGFSLLSFIFPLIFWPLFFFGWGRGKVEGCGVSPFMQLRSILFRPQGLLSFPAEGGRRKWSIFVSLAPAGPPPLEMEVNRGVCGGGVVARV